MSSVRVSTRCWMLLWVPALVCLMAACEAFSDADAVPRPSCSGDQDCQDGVFCNGAEACAPSSPGADAFGCLPASPAEHSSDGIECTIDRCDEAERTITHDPSLCECTSDARCAALDPRPCALARCAPSFFCEVTLEAQGVACDDGVDCTVSTVCTAEGFCRGEADDGSCADGLFCNGEERCQPDAAGADPITGCSPGLNPLTDPALDDGIACTVPSCDEDSGVISHVPTGSCECLRPEDCADGTCQAFDCDPETGFTCAARPGDLLNEGAPCDDGFGCTEADRCDGAGHCAGDPVNTLCEDDDPCDGQELCQPLSTDSDDVGCVRGEAPIDPPEGCP